MAHPPEQNNNDQISDVEEETVNVDELLAKIENHNARLEHLEGEVNTLSTALAEVIDSLNELNEHSGDAE